jgi:hypothetical protein
MLRPRSRPYSRIRALPASLPRTRPGHPGDEAPFRMGSRPRARAASRTARGRRTGRRARG